MLMDKVRVILGSIRFWIVTLGFAAKFLAGVETDGFTMVALLNEITLWLGAVATIGTVDSVAVKFGAALRGRK